MRPINSLRLGLLMLGLGGAWSAPAADPQLLAESVSRQFTVIASERALPSLGSQTVPKQLGLIQLTPAVAAVNCERVKEALLRLLRQPDQWRGRIVVTIQPTARGNLDVTIVPTLYADGWRYRVEMPTEVSPERFVSAITQTLLLEMANRGGGSRCAELPLWLSEGTALMVARGELNLLVEANISRFQTVVAPDPLAKPRARFTDVAPLTFDALSWPTAAQRRGPAREVFRDSAQLLVHALLARPGGPAAMTDFVRRLGGNLNWQTSFLKAFGKDFGLLIDVEKWWAVTVAAFSGKNQFQMWTPEEAMTRLDQALRIEVEQPQAADALPERTTVNLQTLITDWDFERQLPALNGVLRQLTSLRLNCPPDLSQLVDAYRTALEAYANKRGGGPLAVARREPGFSLKLILRETRQRLDELDARREMWRREYAVARSSGTR
jgi:hypothetical protein